VRAIIRAFIDFLIRDRDNSKLLKTDLSVDGRQVRKSTETMDRKQAQRIFDKIKGEVAEGKWFEHLEGEDRTFN